ncbi:MAG: EAL domain-containing protein, partial [Hyphomicrobiales bacterium]
FRGVEGVDRVTLIKKNRYALSYTPTGDQDFAEEDFIYLADPDDPNKIVQKINGNPNLPELSRNSFGPIFGNVYAQSCATFKGDICYMTMIPAQKVLSENLSLILLLVVFSLALGWLVCERVSRSVRRRLTPRGRIQAAMQNGGNNFYCHYQPILSLKTMQVEGCEVLARFEDNYGPLYPDQFIPIVQDIQCTWDFTENILNKALDDLRPLLEDKQDFKISINFFPEDLENDRFFQVKQSQVLANALENGITLSCEILETGIRQGSSITDALDYLRSLGCMIAIDDFGTGFSNLAQIRELKPDLIKIDKVFVEDLSPNTEVAQSAFLYAILDIARAHNLKVCAEGIETMEQLASLQNQNVDYGQGYFFAKPMPIEDFGLNLLKSTFSNRFRPDDLLSEFLATSTD